MLRFGSSWRVRIFFPERPHLAYGFRSTYGQVIAVYRPYSADRQGLRWVDLDCSPSRRGMTGVCAHRTAAVDVKLPLQIAAADVALGTEQIGNDPARSSPERTLVVSDQMARIDVTQTLRNGGVNVAIGR